MDNGHKRNFESGRDHHKGIAVYVEKVMSKAKQEVEAMLNKLPDDSSLEDIQYHLYVLEKVQRGIERANTEGVIQQTEVEERLGKWLTK